MDTPPKTPEAEARLGAAFDAAFNARALALLDAEFDVVFETTPDVRRHRAKLRRLLSAEEWKWLVSLAEPHIRESYKRGEVGPWDAVQSIGRLSVGCRPDDRLRLVGGMAMFVMCCAPRTTGRRKPKYPTWTKEVAAAFYLSTAMEEPGRRVPNRTRGRQADDTAQSPPPLADRVLKILDAVGWFGRHGQPAPETLDRWARDFHRKVFPDSPLQPGRPKKR